MKKIIACIILLALSTQAQEPYPVTIDSRASVAPDVEVFRANRAQFTASFVDGRNMPSEITGTPFMRWFASDAATNTGAATYEIQSASNGIVVFSFAPESVNYDAGGYLYEIGQIVDGAPQTYKQGNFDIINSPIGVGTTNAIWQETINFSTKLFVGATNLVTGDGVTILQTTNELGGVILSASGVSVVNWESVSGKPFTNLVDLTTNTLTGIDWASLNLDLAIQQSSVFVAWTNAGATVTSSQVIATSPLLENGVADVVYTLSGGGFGVVDTSTDATNWTAFTETITPSYVRVSVDTSLMPVPDEVTISGIAAYSWTRPDLYGRTNDTQGQTVQVDTPINARDVANKAYVDSAAQGVTSSAWSHYPATQAVYLAGNQLILGEHWSVIETNGLTAISYGEMSVVSNGMVIANNGTKVMEFLPGYVGLAITNIAITGSVYATVFVATNGVDTEPLLQYTASLTEPSWSLVALQSGTYPATSNGAYAITATLPSAVGFVRAVRQTGAEKILAYAPFIATTVQASTSAGLELKSNNGTTGMTIGAGGGANVTTADGLIVGGRLAAGSYSATITPYLIPMSTNITISEANGMHQAVTGTVPSSVTINFPTGSATSEMTISLTIPPVGTNAVTLAAGPTYYYVSPLSSSAAASTNLYTRYYVSSPYGTTNVAVTAMGEVQ